MGILVDRRPRAVVRQLTAAVAVPVIAVTVLAGCGVLGKSGGRAGGNTARPSGPVTVGISAPEHLVPGNTVDPAGVQVLDALFTPLVTVGTDKPVMAAARSVTSPDAKVWTITLQDGYTFGDGHKVTAADYVRAWNFTAYGPHAQLGADLFSRIAGYDQMQSPDGKAKPRATALSGVRQTGDGTIQVTLTRPFAQFVSLLSAHAFDPLPADAFAADGSITPGYENAPVGNGPYRLRGPVDAASGTIGVDRVDAYPGTRPALDHIDFKVYKDPATAYGDLAAGRLDVLPQIPSASLGKAAATLGGRMQRTPSAYLAYLAVPGYLPALRKPDLRKALSMAIDRPAIARKIFLDTYRPADSWTSATVPGGRDDACGATCRFDPAAAKQLYNQAGGLPGNSLQIFYNADGGHREWVDEVCGQLRTNLAITCTGTPLPLAQLADRNAAKGLAGLVSGAWSPDYPAAEDYLAPLYRTSAAHNDAGYHNPRFDKLLDQADAATSDADAIARYQAAEDLLAADLPTIPLWLRDTVSGRSTRMDPLSVDAFGTVDVTRLRAR